MKQPTTWGHRRDVATQTVKEQPEENQNRIKISSTDALGAALTLCCHTGFVFALTSGETLEAETTSPAC